nr:mechanosensitive ion channel [Bacteroidales bacterium]
MEDQVTQVQVLLESVMEYILKYGLKILGGIAFLIVGLWIAKIITKNIKKLMLKQKLDEALIGFVNSLVSIGLKALVVISTMGMIGIEMTSFIAILAAAGLAVGLALQGTLQNFAGGVLTLILKPYKIGDYVSMVGYDGVVKEIRIFNTILVTVDNKTVIIPNGSISTASLINFSTQKTRRVE